MSHDSSLALHDDADKEGLGIAIIIRSWLQMNVKGPGNWMSFLKGTQVRMAKKCSSDLVGMWALTHCSSNLTVSKICTQCEMEHKADGIMEQMCSSDFGESTKSFSSWETWDWYSTEPLLRICYTFIPYSHHYNLLGFQDQSTVSSSHHIHSHTRIDQSDNYPRQSGMQCIRTSLLKDITF